MPAVSVRTEQRRDERCGLENRLEKDDADDQDDDQKRQHDDRPELVLLRLGGLLDGIAGPLGRVAGPLGEDDNGSKIHGGLL